MLKVGSMTVAEMGRMGGKAAAKAMTKKQRQERARKGGLATKGIKKRRKAK